MGMGSLSVPVLRSPGRGLHYNTFAAEKRQMTGSIDRNAMTRNLSLFVPCAALELRPTFPLRRRHVHHWVLFALANTALACSTAAGGSTGSGGGGTGGPGPDPTTTDAADEGSGGDGLPIPPQYGDQCGESIALGWDTVCRASSTIREYTNPLTQIVVELDDEFEDFGPLCCEGMPSYEEANAGCEELCFQRLCGEALETHLWWATEVAPGCWDGLDPNCGFDMDACLAGTVHEQIIDDPNDDLDPVDYFLEVGCNALNTSGRSVTGTWDWIQFPENDPSDDPPMCSSPAGIGDAPGARQESFSASESAGTHAVLMWDFGEIGGIESSHALSVDLGYGLIPCGNGASLCIDLRKLDVSVSDVVAQGLQLSHAHLSLEEAPASPFAVVAGRFTVPDGALRFLLSANVDGVPVILSGTNDGATAGHLTEEGVTLSGLRFSYEDPLFAATVQIEVASAHHASKPRSAISVLDAPLDCNQPVAFHAATDEPDGEAVSYQWWLPPLTLGSSNTVEAVLPAGNHAVLLMTSDASGRTDATAMSYRRSCK